MRRANVGRSFKVGSIKRTELVTARLCTSRPFLGKGFDFKMSLAGDDHRRGSRDRGDVVTNRGGGVRRLGVTCCIRAVRRLNGIAFHVNNECRRIGDRCFVNNEGGRRRSRVCSGFFPATSLSLPVKGAVIRLDCSGRYCHPLCSRLDGAIRCIGGCLCRDKGPCLRPSCDSGVSLGLECH